MAFVPLPPGVAGPELIRKETKWGQPTQLKRKCEKLGSPQAAKEVEWNMDKRERSPVKAPRKRKPKSWHDEVVSFLESRREELEKKEGNTLSVEYLETCMVALETCKQLGIVLRRPEE